MSKQKKPQKNQLPKQVYITTDSDGIEDYLCAWKSLDELDDDTELVGVYELTKIGSLAITRELK